MMTAAEYKKRLEALNRKYGRANDRIYRAQTKMNVAMNECYALFTEMQELEKEYDAAQQEAN